MGGERFQRGQGAVPRRTKWSEKEVVPDRTEGAPSEDRGNCDGRYGVLDLKQESSVLFRMLAL